MGIDVADDRAFRRRERRLQRVGLATVAAFLTAGLLGLCGASGPLSDATARRGSVAVAYARFLHHQADSSITVRTAGTAELEISRDWWEAVEVDALQPGAAEEVHTAGGVRLRFAAEPGAPVLVTVTFRPQRYGIVRGQVRSGPDTVGFPQFVYP